MLGVFGDMNVDRKHKREQPQFKPYRVGIAQPTVMAQRAILREGKEVTHNVCCFS